MNVPFREVVGSLMWIATQTRPGIANAVRVAARVPKRPSDMSRVGSRGDKDDASYVVPGTILLIGIALSLLRCCSRPICHVLLLSLLGGGGEQSLRSR